MLTRRTLPLRSARFHWRANLPVVLGVAVGAAVLSGALLVGDSLRGSLRDRAVRQLNGVEAAYVGTRFLRDDLARELPGEVVPALIVPASLRTGAALDDLNYQSVKATVVALDAAGWKRFGLPGEPAVAPDAEGRIPVVFGNRTAGRLGVAVGDTLDLGVEKLGTAPRSSFLGKRAADDVAESVRVDVARVLPADHPANDFNLLPNPAAPLNLFVPLPLLQAKIGKPGRVNALLGMAGSAPELTAALRSKLTLDDWGVRVRVPAKRPDHVCVEAEELVLSPTTARAAEDAAADIGATSRRTLAYLANAISAGAEPVWNNAAGDPAKLVPYSVVAALDPAAPAPLGPFLPPGKSALAADEIALAAWPESPLKNLRPGDPVTVTFFKPEMEAGERETSATFKFAGFVPLTGAADDPDLTPPFPGITDKLRIDQWDPPFHVEQRRIQHRDEEFWKKHRTTPKAYLTAARGDELFGSRFGTVTAVRVAPVPGTTPAATAERLRPAILAKLDPATAGLGFEPTRDRLLTASRGGTDFGGLFLAFSFFLIASALLLVGLMFRLAVDRRAKEVGLLLATGYPAATVRSLLLREGIAVAVVGAAVGLGGAVGFAAAMIGVLVDLWPDREVGAYLRLHVTPVSLGIGFAATVIVSAVAIRFSLRGLTAVPPPALLRGVTAVVEVGESAGNRPLRSLIGVGVCTIAGVAMLVLGGGQANPDFRAMTFFTGGGLLLAAGLLLARVWLRRPRDGVTRSRGVRALAGLGVRNAGRNPGRSLLTATLIAVATFLLVAVESFRRRPDLDFAEKTGGSGGFRLIAEADVPVFRPFAKTDDPEDVPVPSTDPRPAPFVRPPRFAGLEDLLAGLEKVYQNTYPPDAPGPTVGQRVEAAEKELAGVTVYPFRLQGGDDASCLNLFQAGRPRVLGVPDEIVKRGGFRFAETSATTPEETANPWLLLAKPQPDGAVPVFAEQNSAMWMLKTGVGGTIPGIDGDGRPVTFRLVATLQDSVFQSELLVSDANFRTLYPRTEGFRVFLLDTPPGTDATVTRLVETGLQTHGLAVSPTRDRVAAYQAVVGTYLTTFQLLGGFGLLLGVLGLGVVILRGVWERVGELALLRAVGYRTRALQTMILAENLLLLAVGLGIGTTAAVASVVPNLALGGSLGSPRLGLMLVGVFAAGLVVSVAATAGVARVSLIPALRKE